MSHQPAHSHSSASQLACLENQRIVKHLAKVAHRCLVTKREGYRFSILKAIKSVKLFPLPIESLEECLMLDGVGPSIAAEMMKAVVVVDENAPKNRTTTTKTTKKRAEHPTKGSQSPCAIKSPLLKRPCPVVPSVSARSVDGSRGPPMVCVDLTEENDDVEVREGQYDHPFEYDGVLDENDWGCVMSSHVENDVFSSSAARNRFDDDDKPYQHTLATLNDDDDNDDDRFEGKGEDEDDVIPSLSQLRITNTSKSSSRQPECNSSNSSSSQRGLPRPPPPSATATLPPAAEYSDSYQRARSQLSIPAAVRSIPNNHPNTNSTTHAKTKTNTVDCSGTTPGFGCSDPTASPSSCATRRLPGGEKAWEAVLLIDTREKDHLMVQSMMIERGVPCEVHTLVLGDFLWAARRRTNQKNTNNDDDDDDGSHDDGDDEDDDGHGQLPQELSKRGRQGLLTEWVQRSGSVSTSQPSLSQQQQNKNSKKTKGSNKGSHQDKGCDEMVVLDCVAERKTTADLASSIVDGRYGEQKHRLLDCGLHTRMYIVEGLSLTAPSKFGGNVSAGALKTAMVSTHVNHGLQVVRTRGLDHTISILQTVHKLLSRRFQRGECACSREPSSSLTEATTNNDASTRYYLPLSEFQKRFGKKSITTVGQAFAMQLRALPGCSLAAAAALTDRFGTYIHLHQAVMDVMDEAAMTTNAVSSTNATSMTQENKRNKGSDKNKNKTTATVIKEGQTRLIADVMKLQGKGTGGQRIGNKVAETIWRQVVTY